jgi:hypothetical protein
MAHDHNGRVGPPRCEECNAPLSSDERHLDSVFTRCLCLECQFALNLFQLAERQSLPSRRAQAMRGH